MGFKMASAPPQKWPLCSPAALERVCFSYVGLLCPSQVFHTWKIACRITDAFHIFHLYEDSVSEPRSFSSPHCPCCAWPQLRMLHLFCSILKYHPKGSNTTVSSYKQDIYIFERESEGAQVGRGRGQGRDRLKQAPCPVRSPRGSSQNAEIMT